MLKIFRGRMSPDSLQGAAYGAPLLEPSSLISRIRPRYDCVICLTEFFSNTNPYRDCSVFKFLRHNVDGKHLMHFEGETSTLYSTLPQLISDRNCPQFGRQMIPDMVGKRCRRKTRNRMEFVARVEVSIFNLNRNKS